MSLEGDWVECVHPGSGKTYYQNNTLKIVKLSFSIAIFALIIINTVDVLGSPTAFCSPRLGGEQRRGGTFDSVSCFFLDVYV